MRIPSPSFDEWYQCTFVADSDVPPAVSVDAPDATAQLDIEIYNFSSRAQTISLGSCESSYQWINATSDMLLQLYPIPLQQVLLCQLRTTDLPIAMKTLLLGLTSIIAGSSTLCLLTVCAYIR
jgi:hypothetical protein